MSALLSASRGSPAAAVALRPLLSRAGPAPSSTSVPRLPRKAVRVVRAAFAFPSLCTLRFPCGARPPAPAMAMLRVQPEAQAKVSAAGLRRGSLGRRGSERLQASVTRPPVPIASRGRGHRSPREPRCQEHLRPGRGRQVRSACRERPGGRGSAGCGEAESWRGGEVRWRGAPGHTQGAGAALPPHGLSHGRAPGPPHRVRGPCPSRRGSYTSPCTAQETRGISWAVDHSPFTARNVLIPHNQPHGDQLHPSQPHGMHSTLPQVRPYTTLRVRSSNELAISQMCEGLPVSHRWTCSVKTCVPR